MCDTKGHEHWCSGCGKNLNEAPADSYIEIEWTQTDKGLITNEKGMVCKECIEKMPNVKELNEYFSKLQYKPYGHVFCSSCKKDITKEYKDSGILTKIGNPAAGRDYECVEFKEHLDKSHTRHIIKVAVLCKECSEKCGEKLQMLKKLGRNPMFNPILTCPNTEECKQYIKGNEQINCKNLVIGRDRESLNMAILCGRKHKGALPLPFDDGISIIRPRKKKGAALANVPALTASPILQPLPFADSFKDMEKVFDTIFKKYKIGKHGVSEDRIKKIEERLTKLETIEK